MKQPHWPLGPSLVPPLPLTWLPGRPSSPHWPRIPWTWAARPPPTLPSSLRNHPVSLCSLPAHRGETKLNQVSRVHFLFREEMEQRKKLIDTTKNQTEKSRTWAIPQNNPPHLYKLRTGLKKKKKGRKDCPRIRNLKDTVTKCKDVGS